MIHPSSLLPFSANNSPLFVNFHRLLLLLCLLTLYQCSDPETPSEESVPEVVETPDEKPVTPQTDPLAPTSSGENALVGPLYMVTLASNDFKYVEYFYSKGMGMTMEGPIPQPASKMQRQRRFWDIPKVINWKTYRLHRPSAPGTIQIRLMLIDKETPTIHQSTDSRELGPFSLGFPNLNQKQLDAEIRSMGFEAMADLQEGKVSRPDGSSYRYLETIFQAPDFVHAVGIERKDGMPQLGPVDEKTSKGGPAYSAQVIENADEFLSFLTEVLDWEVRADRQWTTSPGSALGLPEGIPFRFSLAYAKGASSGHLLFIDYEDDSAIATDVAPKVPNRGLGMWTFQTRDIQEVKRRAEAHGTKIIYGPVTYDEPILGMSKVMTMLAPNGFLIEIFEK